jgi:hypothetical protein
MTTTITPKRFSPSARLSRRATIMLLATMMLAFGMMMSVAATAKASVIYQTSGVASPLVRAAIWFNQDTSAYAQEYYKTQFPSGINYLDDPLSISPARIAVGTNPAAKMTARIYLQNYTTNGWVTIGTWDRQGYVTYYTNAAGMTSGAWKFADVWTYPTMLGSYRVQVVYWLFDSSNRQIGSIGEYLVQGDYMASGRAQVAQTGSMNPGWIVLQ